MILQDFLPLLVCPETKQPVRLLGAEEVSQLNSRISAGEIRNRSGELVSGQLEAALVREDGKLFYPVRDGIPVMLTGESILL